MRKIFNILVILSFLISCTDSPIAQLPGNQEEEAVYGQGFKDMKEDNYQNTSGEHIVSAVVMPRAFAPVLHSDEITISMHGFTDNCSLLFIDKKNNEHVAYIRDYDSQKIIFSLPDSVISGDYRLVLRSGDSRQELGSRYVLCDMSSDTEGINVTGKVLISGQSAPRVVVSDGFEFTVTDEQGIYHLVSKKENGYVFVQTPANAAAKVKKAVPQFFRYLSASSDVRENLDFELDYCDNTDHRVFFVTDLHISYYRNFITYCNEQFMPDFRASLSESDLPTYIFTAGDQTTESKWVSGNFDLHDWMDYISDWPGPVFTAMGNHDNDPQYVASDWNAESTFKKIVGPSWFSLDIGKVHYVMLDNIVYDNSDPADPYSYFVRVAPDQLEYLRKDLSKVAPSTPVIIISHAPLFMTSALNEVTPRFESYDDINNLLDCLDAFEKVHILSGHSHVNHNVEVRPGIYEHNMSSSSASTWLCQWQTGTNAHYCRDGVIGGYKIWDMKGSDISWVHKSLDRPVKDGQFHCVDMNMVPSDFKGKALENDVLINVYNYDSAWKIKVTEDGESRQVRQVYRKDPVYNIIFPTKISSQTTPANNEHMFMVQASSANSTLEVEVTDRFGNVYRKTMKRPYDFTLTNYL